MPFRPAWNRKDDGCAGAERGGELALLIESGFIRPDGDRFVEGVATATC